VKIAITHRKAVYKLKYWHHKTLGVGRLIREVFEEHLISLRSESGVCD